MKPLRHRDLLLSLKYSTVEASFSVPMLNLTMPNLPFCIAFAVQALGAGPAFVALMAAIPHLANFIQPPITAALKRRLSLYEIMALGFIFSALPWAFVSFLPREGNQLAALTVILLIATVGNSVGAVAWSASIAEIVPPRIGGRFFGRRNLVFGFWTLSVVFAAGALVDWGHNSLLLYGALFAAAASARLIGLFFLSRMKFPAQVMGRQEQAVTKGEFLLAMDDPNYRRLILFIGLWGLLLNAGMPFYTVFLLSHLQFTVGQLVVLTTIGSLGGLIALKGWGKLCDRFGNKPVMAVCALLWAVGGMVSWLMASPTSTWHLYVNYFVVGAATAGFQLCQFNLMIRLAAPEKRAAYISTFLSLTSVLTALGPLLGGLALGWLPDVVGTFFGQPVRDYHFLFAGSLLGCLLLVDLQRRIREPAEEPAEAVWKTMRSMRTFNPLLGMATVVQFLFTPRGITGLARQSVRSLRRHARSLTDVGDELVSGSKEILGKREKP